MNTLSRASFLSEFSRSGRSTEVIILQHGGGGGGGMWGGVERGVGRLHGRENSATGHVAMGEMRDEGRELPKPREVAGANVGSLGTEEWLR